MTTLEDRDYSVKEVAEIFQVHTETVKLWLNGKMGPKMNGYKKSNVWFIPSAEVQRYAELKYGSQE